VISALILLFAFTALYMSATSRIKAYIKIVSLQGVILFLILFFREDDIFRFNFIFLAVETLLVKAVVIPLFLSTVLGKSPSLRESDPRIPNFYSLVICSVMLFSGFIISNLHSDIFEHITPLYFGISISTIFISLFIITTKKNILTHVVGYIMMENGIFLLSLSVAKEMPMVVNMGVLLDLFIAVFILGLFISRINSAFEEADIHSLTSLKDYGDDD